MTTAPSAPPFSIGYGTNGFTDHPLPEVLELLHEFGYGAVAMTLGHPHLDPFAPDLEARLSTLRSRLEELDLRVVIETGTRFLLNPREKHRPALVDEEAAVRVDFLHRAVDIAAALNAECVSFFSGILPLGTSPETGWHRLETRVAQVLGHASEKGVLLALEPEPGMFVETVADALELRSRLGDPEGLRLTVDIGHCVVVEPGGVRGALMDAGPLLANVQLDDMRSVAHEHLPFGEGEVDVPLALATLTELDYRGVAAVELPRHSFDAPGLAVRSMAALQSAWQDVQAERVAEQWLQQAVARIAADPAALPAVFAAAGRSVGRSPLHPATDPTAVLHGNRSDYARGELLRRLAGFLSPGQLAETLLSLYSGGDSAERRGVLRGLGSLAIHEPDLPAPVVAAGLQMTAEALRTNETGLVAAAAGPFAAAHLDQHNWRHAVLKLIFMGVSLAAVTDLNDRADDELARMAADFAAERQAAGRPVPDDVGLLLRTEASPTTSLKES
ncbi:EboA domain-containing protein [Arthrobacter caoxuetaonis]|uniref:EboA domain-containing protein n=1 Tax=Arthrobacter caoxuetaonis TaxID=2886935 RepID=A0A9X1MDQ5_9MICC|nr:EboA domain-containing protein [Arthrobacter caoxuetaonis]MCC3298118.1 EboA domain-containing protein [Arthrobacter caoxuetaonis]USQ57125.1 EboA domain-containing protein [Arthrobacter caoxuetaonis]